MSNPLAELADPNTSAQRLAELAQQHPELGPQIAAHPNAYDGLREWIAHYATPAAPEPESAAPAQPWAPTQQLTQPTTPLPAAGYAATQPTTPLTYGQDPASPHAQTPFGVSPADLQPAAQPGKSKKGLWIGVGAGGLALLLALGGVLWWMIGGKIGGSASGEAAAKKLVTSVTKIDPLALYGSFAPSEFSLFEPASQKLLELQPEADTQSAQELIQALSAEVTVKTVAPLETSTTVLVADEVERIEFTDGVIELSGDSDTIAATLMDYMAPIVQAQAEAGGYPLTDKEIAEAQDQLAESMELPYRIDLSDPTGSSEGPLRMVAVNEPGGWYVSPLMTPAYYSYRAAGGDDRALGGEIAEPAKDGAKTPEAAATQLTEAIFDGDYDSIVAQLPFAERRAASVYAPGFFELSGSDPTELERQLRDLGVSLDTAEFTATGDGGTARLQIDDLSLTSKPEASESSGAESRLSISGTCFTVSGERGRVIDPGEYSDYYTDYLNDFGYSGDFSDYLSEYGPNTTERYEESGCLEDGIPYLSHLGADEWRIVAVEEGGTWSVSPIATVADISTIIAAKIQEAAERGRLGELFDS